MKKHQIGFIASALAFPVITCTLYLSMGSMLKGNNWKTEKDVFPIFGKFNNGRNKPASQKTVIQCDSIILKNDDNYAEFIEDSLPQQTAAMLLDTSDYNIARKTNGTVSIEPKNEFSSKLLNRIPAITLINSTCYLNNKNFIPAEKTQIALRHSTVFFYGEHITKKHPQVPIQQKAFINVELSDSSVITINNSAVMYDWKITIKNNSSLNIQVTNPEFTLGKYEIRYDESCKINMPASFLKYCTLIKVKE